MQIGSKFSIAIHIMLSAEVFKESHKITSDFIAASVRTNPVIIRRIMALLKDANLIEVAPGTGGITLTKNPKNISLKEIYQSVDPVKDGQLFKIHQDSEPRCPVGSKIEKTLTPYFFKAQTAMESELSKYSLKNLLDDLDK